MSVHMFVCLKKTEKILKNIDYCNDRNTMKILLRRLITSSLILLSPPIYADLALSSSCFNNPNTDICKGLLIGNIDAAQASGRYCPDGRTSYADIINAWATDMKRFPQKQSISTYEGMVNVIRVMGLSCKK